MKPDKSDVPRLDRTVFVLFVMLLVVRLGMVAVYPVLARAMPQWGWANNDGYDTIAVNLVTTGTFALENGIPTAARLPLYPWLIAACYAILGDAYPVAVMLIQALLSFSTGVYLYLTTKTLFGRNAAIATAALFILHPQVNNFVFRCATETLFSFLVMAALYHAVRYVQKQRLKELVLATWWLSLSLLTRQTLAPMAFACLPLLLLIRTGGSPRFVDRLLHTTVAVITAVLVLAPWLFETMFIQAMPLCSRHGLGSPCFRERMSLAIYRYFFKARKR